MATRTKSAGRTGRVVLLALLVGGLMTAARGAPAVVVTQAPATVERRTFDPLRPPADMPPLTPPEAGACQSEFSFETQVGIEGPTKATPGKASRVVSVKMNLRLAIIIWTIAQPPEKLRAHEEAHREIAETHYARARGVAVNLGKGLIGRPLNVPVDNSPEMRRAIDRVQSELLTAFQRETSDRCEFAQAQFDLITEHGTNSVPEREAITRALAALPHLK